MEIRKASMDDWEEIQKIYASARQFMAEHGNAGQWGTNYPQEELLLDDIAQGKLYVCTEDGIAAVFYFAAGEDPTYRRIEDGAWLNEEPYGVVHRIASARTVKGAASFCIDWALEQSGNIRIDTHAGYASEKWIPLLREDIPGKRGTADRLSKDWQWKADRTEGR